MKRRPYLYFLSNTTVITVQGALFGVHVLQFRNTCSKYSWIKLFADGVRTAKTVKVSSRENLSAYGTSRQFYKMVVCTKHFYVQRQAANHTHIIHCAHQAWRYSCHSSEVTVKTLRLTAIKNDMGATLTKNDDMCDIPKSSPEVLFSTKIFN